MAAAGLMMFAPRWPGNVAAVGTISRAHRA
jgi:hypothetical protein